MASEDNIGESNEASNKQTWDDKVVARFSPFWGRFKVIFITFLFLSAFLATYLFNHIFINIYPGEVGVLWQRFGEHSGTQEKKYFGGLHVINPFNKMYKYEVRSQQRETTFTVLSNNGLPIKIRASIRFQPNIESLNLLHEAIGPDYVERVVIPEVQAAMRRVIGEYEPNDIYATQRNIVKNVVLTAASELQDRYITLDDLLIKEIHLPPAIEAAIENKLTEEQLLLAYQYINEREKEEAKRKKIEAGGIKDFQNTIEKGLTPAYLRFKGINATLELAKSPNAKLVVIGNNQDGLPLILNTPDDYNADTYQQSLNSSKEPDNQLTEEQNTNTDSKGKAPQKRKASDGVISG